MYADKIVQIDKKFSSQKEIEEFINSLDFINQQKETFGLELPFLYVFQLGGSNIYCTPAPTKQGIPMDWEFFSELSPITPAAINNEPNIEKRRLLMMEYGIANYIQNIRVISTDEHYGVLLDAEIDDGNEVFTQRFVKVKNGTQELPEAREYLASKNMLTDDYHKIYYIPVSSEVSTAKAGIEESWGLPENILPDTGWDFET